MADLYQRQGGTLNAPVVNKPVVKDNIIGDTLSTFAKYINKKADENFVLGTKQITDDIINASYKLNPTDPKKFLEDVQSNVSKSADKLELPKDYREKVINNVMSKARGYVAKIEGNIQKKIETENKNLVINSYNNNIAGQNEFYNSMISAIVNRDDRSYEAFKQTYKDNKTQAEALINNALDRNGNPIITKSAVKELEINKVNIIKDNLYSLDYDGLVAFDDSFQDRKRFTQQADITNEQYDDIEKFIKRRRKEFNEEDERKLQSQNYYNALVMAKSFDSAKTNQLIKDGVFTKEMAKQFKDYAEKDYNETLITDEDENFIMQFSKLNKLATSKNDGSKDYNQKYLKDASNVLAELKAYINKNGTNEDINSIITDTFINVSTNQQYADSLAPMFDKNTALGQTLGGTKNKILEKIKNKEEPKFLDLFSDMNNLFKEEQELKKVEKVGKSELANNLRNGLSIATNLLNPFLPEETKQLVNDALKKQIDKTNKDVIKSKYALRFGDAQLEEAEKKFNEGKDAFLYNNGKVYKFKGYTQNDIILEEGK